MTQATHANSTTRAPGTRPAATFSPNLEIPQPPRFAVQRLVGDSWQTITFNDGAEDDPYRGTPLLYQSRYVAEHVARVYAGEVRVHEIGGAQ